MIAHKDMPAVFRDACERAFALPNPYEGSAGHLAQEWIDELIQDYLYAANGNKVVLGWYEDGTTLDDIMRWCILDAQKVAVSRDA